MTAVYAFLTKLLPFAIAFADGDGGTGFMAKLVGWAAGIGGGIVALFLIVSLVKDGIEFAKGQGSVSVFKIIGKALFLILIIGLVFLAVNYATLGNTAKDLGQGVIDKVNDEANVILK